MRQTLKKSQNINLIKSRKVLIKHKYRSIDLFVPPFLYSLKTSENRKAF